MVRRREKIIFIDFEASGLSDHSFPIEFGWAWLVGGSGARLIRPSLQWDLGGWDGEAAEVHGVTLERLVAEGEPAREVAEFVFDLTSREGGAVTVVSDGAEFDQRWLDMLRLETPDVGDLRVRDVRALARERFGEVDALEAALLVEGVERAHRAEADALALRDAWVRFAQARA